MTVNYDEDMILGYVEGGLTPDQERSFRQILASDPRLRQLVEGLASDRENLRKLPAEPIPDDLIERITAVMERDMLLEPTHTQRIAVRSVRDHHVRRVSAYGALAAMVLISVLLVVYTLTDEQLSNHVALKPQKPTPSGPVVAMESFQEAPSPLPDHTTSRRKNFDPLHSGQGHEEFRLSDATVHETDSRADARQTETKGEATFTNSGLSVASSALPLAADEAESPNHLLGLIDRDKTDGPLAAAPHIDDKATSSDSPVGHDLGPLAKVTDGQGLATEDFPYKSHESKAIQTKENGQKPSLRLRSVQTRNGLQDNALRNEQSSDEIDRISPFHSQYMMKIDPADLTTSAMLHIATDDVPRSQLSLGGWIDQHAKAQPVDTILLHQRSRFDDSTSRSITRQTESISSSATTTMPTDGIIFFVDVTQIPQLLNDLESPGSQQLSIRFEQHRAQPQNTPDHLSTTAAGPALNQPGRKKSADPQRESIPLHQPRNGGWISDPYSFWRTGPAVVFTQPAFAPSAPPSVRQTPLIEVRVVFEPLLPPPAGREIQDKNTP